MATPRIKSAQDFKIEAIEALKGQLDCYVLEEEKRAVQASLERVEAIQTMRTPDKPERLTYSVPEAAMVVGISKASMYTIANRQDFPKIRLGTKIVIPIKEFEQWISDEAMREAQQWQEG
ncbi:Helix-turn-helix domain-containing protein [Eubacterium aggregans]|uniref:Helix-turn-helix domain-containing protein n=1 Tax=Eubacterium aggregans TaxID=81409 RepID=A0A1H3X4B7_9FIRM|nr:MULTISPECIES: helix-turn-helix domain-containing protein [Clostridia]MEA5004313.1 helix-turn-helix domain-containing protein [Christensenella sp.]SDZ93831.1 Helix-turn-helix domain-containing protein [Eubacterium aggregans]